MGGKLTDSYLDEGFILDKTIGVNCPKRIENAKILIANTCKDVSRRMCDNADFLLPKQWTRTRSRSLVRVSRLMVPENWPNLNERKR